LIDWTDIEQRLRTRLTPVDLIDAQMARSDHDLNPEWRDTTKTGEYRPAAVLVPIVKRPQAWTMLLTQRAADLPSHAGQVAFPGGRVDPGDLTAVDTARREAHEEVGLEPRFVEPLGAIEPYQTGTGFRIAPIVGFVAPGFEQKMDTREVADIFEVPFAFLMDPANHELREAEWRGQRRSYYAMPYEDRFIWGATAGMIRALYERLYR
jgi:8-oxo-dGTP pyrophosphatase MutT (NUDIX family)